VHVVFVAPGAIRSAIGAANDKRTLLKPDSLYAKVESYVRSRGSWSQSKPYLVTLGLVVVAADHLPTRLALNFCGVARERDCRRHPPPQPAALPCIRVPLDGGVAVVLPPNSGQGVLVGISVWNCRSWKVKC
jgi:hypothetical protein